MVMYGHVWSCMVMYGTSCMVLYGHVWYIMYGHVWSCMVLYDHVWYVMYGLVWSCIYVQCTLYTHDGVSSHCVQNRLGNQEKGLL